MPRADPGALTTARRLSAAISRLSRCVAISPFLCLQLLIWRAALPVLKYIVPVHALAKFMWTAPAHRLRGAANVNALNYVWLNGGRLLVSPNCLERSLVLYRVLSKAGAGPNLVFGVTRGNDGVAGHAWIEMQGRVFPNGEEQAYQRLATFGADGRAVEILSSQPSH